MTEESFMTDPALWRSVGKGADVGLAVGLAIELIGVLGHSHPSPVLVIGTPVACLALLQLVRASVVEMPAPDPVMTPGVSTPEYFVRLRQLERRLDRASRDPFQFEWTVQPMLAQLAAERLRHKHGINMNHEPIQAREVVGEQLWQIMTTSPSTPSQPGTPHRLRELVEAISRI